MSTVIPKGRSWRTKENIMPYIRRLILTVVIAGTATTALAEAALKIVIDQQAAEPVCFAAEELSRYITEASGVPVNVSEEAFHAGGRALYLLEEQGTIPETPPMPSSLDEEAYRIRSVGDTGRSFKGRSARAVLYGVYDFLEEELGYRWYFPAPEDVGAPILSPDDLAAILRRDIDREARPAFAFREREFRDVMPMTDQTDARIVQQIDWWAKLRMNRFLLNFGYASNPELWRRWKTVLIPEIKRRGMLVGLGEHGSYPMFLPPARYAADHPDWYCEIEGQRVADMKGKQFCTTNPYAVAAYLENFAAFIGDNPEIDFYYPAPNDVSTWCECAQCETSSVADRYMLLDNQIAEMLQGVKPGVRVMHLAYSNHRLPPENVIPHPMIDVDVACWGRDFAHDLGDPQTMPGNDDYLEVFRQWAGLCRSVPGDVRPRLIYHSKLMRHYWLGMHLQPLPILDQDFAVAQDLCLDGFDFPLGFVGIWTKGLNSYVVARKCWTPEVPTAQWVDRFFSDYYGTEAEAARAIYGLVEDAFQDRQYGSSLTLAWHPDMISVRSNPREGLGDNARNAVAKLDEALSMSRKRAKGASPVAKRFQKLSVVLQNARDEQRVLVRLDALMHAYHDFQNAPSDEARRQHLQSAQAAWKAAMAANGALAKSYRVEEDLAGLYWAGETHKSMGNALLQWERAIADLDWQELGRWETSDFQEANESILKTFDITSHIVEIQGAFPGQVQVRFGYESGGLGATTKAVSLWQRDPNGAETLVSKDSHSGFAGYVHENTIYRLQMDTAPNASAHYSVRVELLAYATKGNVAERGCNGKIALGLPKE
jgi:hypothetical protein